MELLEGGNDAGNDTGATEGNNGGTGEIDFDEESSDFGLSSTAICVIVGSSGTFTGLITSSFEELLMFLLLLVELSKFTWVLKLLLWWALTLL